MGVSGCGKTTIGQALSEHYYAAFHDADDYHPVANREKMTAGIPLTDTDRLPWLKALADLLKDTSVSHPLTILSCSALKRSYRAVLSSATSSSISSCTFVYLKVDPEAVKIRLQARKGHFFNPQLLDSQFQVLEEPVDGEGLEFGYNTITIDASKPIEETVADILTKTDLSNFARNI